MQICFASHNENKLREIQQIIPAGFELVGLDQLGVIEEIPETGNTLEENSEQKAVFVFRKFEIPVFADDTGLEVKFLKGQPGVYSARYAGAQRNSEDNMNLLLENLRDATDRSACFKSVITYINAKGNVFQFVGKMEGEIIEEKKGKGGFGYDPIFKPTSYNQTFAEMSSSDKNEISHRARAFRKFIDYLAVQ
ncbi:MAG: RdgB/HAM1 family non-canonical purine NTP pyrophosphatase [Cytophagales bacterium]|nr:RdgB/HAM1 family non-canonical purine NTP pyrophosphatase [Cytophagales bacterium]